MIDGLNGNGCYSKAWRYSLSYKRTGEEYNVFCHPSDKENLIECLIELLDEKAQLQHLVDHYGNDRLIDVLPLAVEKRCVAILKNNKDLGFQHYGKYWGKFLEKELNK